MERTIAATLFAAVMATAASGAATAQTPEPAAKSGATAGPARAERMQKWSNRLNKRFEADDKNRDGALDRAEVEARLNKAFDRRDKNRDGSLDADEVKAIGARQGGKGAKALQARFKRADADRDGKISRQEFLATLPPWFVRADADKDEKVTKQELDAFIAKRGNQAKAAVKADDYEDDDN